VAKNTGDGFRRGQQRDRYQVENLISGLFDLFNSDGQYIRTKKSRGRFKGVELRQPKKPPRVR
jgi:hypothetical protein